MSITINFTNDTSFTIRFAFGDGQMQMSYTIDGTIENYSETPYIEACTDNNGKTNDKISINWKPNGKRTPYLCFTACDLNYLSIRTFSEFANSILSGKSASLTDHLHYDASMNAIILIADNSRRSFFDKTYLAKDLIQFSYCLDNNTDEFISQLNHINAEIESSTPTYYYIN